MTPARVARIGMVLLLAAAAITTACSSGESSGTGAAVPASTPSAADPSVVIIGDSITNQAATELEAAIPGVQIIARPQARTIDLVSLVEDQADRAAEIVVVNIGTNDEGCVFAGGCSDGYRPSDAELEAGVRALLAPFPDACLLAVSLVVALNSPPMTNPILDDLVADGTLDSVIDWAGHHARAEPEDEPWVADYAGHLTPAGARALADLTADELLEACPHSP